MRSLAEWLDYQQRIHPRDIDLGLDRVREVWHRMGSPAPAPVVIIVGGTNGKGSTVAFLEAMLIAAGHRVGSFTSPHLLRYNERVRIFGNDIDDASLIAAFEHIESARAEIPLTYFEFGTLAALWIFAQSKLDVAVLEVGLGGRLDAVNIIDADVAVVTTVDLDHQDWLGNDVDTIGREKAGIFRPDRPAVIGSIGAPRGLLDEAQRIGAKVAHAGTHFEVLVGDRRWIWMSGDTQFELPLPALAAPVQVNNAATAVAALHALADRIGWSEEAIEAGVRNASLPARLQRFVKAGAAEVVVDVGHNSQAARILASWLRSNAPPRTLAVFGALADKDVAGIVAPLHGLIGRWFIGGLDADTPRGLSADALRERMKMSSAPVSFGSIEEALVAAASDSRSGDLILAFGSFFVAAAALTWAARNGYGAASAARQV